MLLKVDKSGGIPIYIQIKEEIKRLLAEGTLKPGAKLPTERELAEELGVSRNTVSMAYQELESEAILLVEQGRGSFINTSQTEKNITKEGSHKEQIIKLLDQALMVGLEAGLTVEQFIAMAIGRAREKEDILSKTRILFVDCNPEQLQNFVYQFREVAQLDITPYSLDKFVLGGPVVENLLNQIDLVVTTNTHRSEVADVLKGFKLSLEIVPVTAQPRFESLIRLTQVAGKERVGLICISEQFPRIVERTLGKLGVHNFEFDYITIAERDRLEGFIDQHRVFLVYTELCRAVRKMVGDKEIIPYVHELDMGSVTLVRQAINRIKKAKRKE